MLASLLEISELLMSFRKLLDGIVLSCFCAFPPLRFLPVLFPFLFQLRMESAFITISGIDQGEMSD
jgi:hypothetical protein